MFQVVLLSEVPSTRSSWELTWHEGKSQPNTEAACGRSHEPSSHSRGLFPGRTPGRFAESGPVFLSWPRAQFCLHKAILWMSVTGSKGQSVCRSYRSTTVALLLATHPSPLFPIASRHFCPLRLPSGSSLLTPALPRTLSQGFLSQLVLLPLVSCLRHARLWFLLPDELGKYISPFPGFRRPMLSIQFFLLPRSQGLGCMAASLLLAVSPSPLQTTTASQPQAACSIWPSPQPNSDI